MSKPRFKNQKGFAIIYEVLIIFIFSMVMLAIVSYALYQLKLVKSITSKEQAFQIAEAGSNYYQWHLAHFPNDYQDGTGVAGPYVHDFIDKDTQQTIGRFSLTITAPPAGTTIVKIQSVGYTLADPSATRTVTSSYGIPSLAKYAFLTNSDTWIGPTEGVSGEFHTNGGIRFDGTGNAPITSSKTTYTCTPAFGCSPSSTQNGIWGAAAQSTKNFWSFPVPNVDFSTITANLATIKTGAQTSGIYLPPSNAQGYSLVFNANNTVSVYKVTSLRSDPTGWGVELDSNGNNVAHPESIDYNARTKLDGDPNTVGVQDYPIPANGLIFVEDKTWVEGTVASRVMVAAANLGAPYNPATAPNIMIPNNIVYTVKDGTVELGLLAQKDVLLSYLSPNNLEIDAALIAQNGSAQRWYYPNNTKNLITIYGAVSSYGTWTWSWGNPVNSGYINTSTTYDANLLYGPPPSFPLDSSGYQQITWSSN
jgi:hypothetical protein